MAKNGAFLKNFWLVWPGSYVPGNIETMPYNLLILFLLFSFIELLPHYNVFLYSTLNCSNFLYKEEQAFYMLYSNSTLLLCPFHPWEIQSIVIPNILAAAAIG